MTWLIGCWVGVKMSQDLRPTLCEVLLTLLQPTEDLVVRFEAANTLRIYILSKTIVELNVRVPKL